MTLQPDDDRAPLDPRGRRLVYVVVADRLEKRIRAGEFGEDGRLPGREQLAQWYGVGARNTVRKAIAVLEGRGLVVTVTGKGTFVL